jgi:hypothetical protein
MRAWSKNIPIGLMIGIGILIYGYLQVPDSKKDSTTRSEDGEVIESGEVGVEILKIGDCVEIPSDVKIGDSSKTYGISSFEVTPCTELHDAEIFSSKILAFTPYPGEDALYGDLSDFCVDDFMSYTGLQYDSSTLYKIFPMIPLEEGWTKGVRRLDCLASLISGEKLGASIRG